jgi:hypothetical protein
VTRRLGYDTLSRAEGHRFLDHAPAASC